MRRRVNTGAHHAGFSTVALLTAGLSLWAAGALAQTKMAPPRAGTSSSVLGIPAASLNGVAGEPSAAKAPSRPAPADNFYGASPPNTFTNTSTAQGPPSTLPPGASPASPDGSAARTTTSVQNPNGVIANAQGPVSNGTGQPLVNDTTIPVPVQETGQAENPQESPSAFGWIVASTILLVGSVYGLIKWTQPGGVA